MARNVIFDLSLLVWYNGYEVIKMLENSLKYDPQPYPFDHVLETLNYVLQSSEVKSYFAEWNQLIYNQEKYIDDDYNDYVMRNANCNKDRYEVYDLGLKILDVNQPYYLNFDVEVLKNYSKNLRPYKSTISEALNYIFWVKPDKKSEYELSTKPIITILNPFFKPKALLVDGNHRMAHYIDNNIKKVKYVYFTKPGPNCFIFRIDYVVYYYIKNINLFLKGEADFSELKMIKEQLPKYFKY